MVKLTTNIVFQVKYNIFYFQSIFVQRTHLDIMPFEATLEEGDILRKVISAIGDLVQDANFDVSDEGIRLQAMDSSHVSLVNLFLSSNSFSHFECEHSTTLGVNFQSLSKVLGCSKPKDKITLRCDDNESDKLSLIFTSPGTISVIFPIFNNEYILYQTLYSELCSCFVLIPFRLAYNPCTVWLVETRWFQSDSHSESLLESQSETHCHSDSVSVIVFR